MGNSTLISGAHTTLRLSGFPTLICVPLSLTVYTREPLAVEDAVEDAEGQMEAQPLHPGGGFLLLLEQGVGDEVDQQELVVGGGSPNGGLPLTPLSLYTSNSW